MTPIPRNQWIEWCEELSHARQWHVEWPDPDHPHRLVTSVDYAPFEDLLEVDVDEAGKTVRHLLDHPSQILVSEWNDTLRVIVRSDTGLVPLTVAVEGVHDVSALYRRPPGR